MIYGNITTITPPTRQQQQIPSNIDSNEQINT